MGFLIQTVALWCLLLNVIATGHNENQPVVTTKYGKLVGRTVEVISADRQADTFLGIPFAKPPVGELRFAAPEPPVPWDSVRDATKDPPMCLQNRDYMKGLAVMLKADVKIPRLSEDCLYLNVFTPSDRHRDSKLPVMVFIHGGGLSVGGAPLFYGAGLCALEKVVVVTIQYRLGFIGFMCTGNNNTRGNYGFLDQVAALHWVQENIAYFGGDPQSVTIVGESAGAVSVCVLVLSPLAKGLFHRAIAQSGTALIPGLIITTQEQIAESEKFVAQKSGCDPASLISCLKEKTEEEIISIANHMGIVSIPACVDGVVLPKSPIEIMVHKEGNNVPLLLGFNEMEFGWMLPKSLNITGLTEGMDKDTVESQLRSLSILEIPPEAIPKIMEEYFGDKNSPQENRNRFLVLCGDIMFIIPALRMAKYHKDSGNPVYFYIFTHILSMLKDSRPDFVKTDHGDDIFFILGAIFLKENVLFKAVVTKEEEQLSRMMMEYWANFARTGNPNGPDLVNWQRYNEVGGYIEFDLKPKSCKKTQKCS